MGSEMCIRDRPPPDRRAAGGGHLGTPLLGEARDKCRMGNGQSRKRAIVSEKRASILNESLRTAVFLQLSVVDNRQAGRELAMPGYSQPH